MSQAKSGMDWYVGSNHDELLDAAVKRRKNFLKALENNGLERKGAATDTKTKSRLAISEVIPPVRKAIESLFDEPFDAFVVFDSNSDGKLHKSEFCEAIRNLNEPSLKEIPDSLLEDLFDSIDTNGDGIITLEEFLSTFTLDKKRGKGAHTAAKVDSKASYLRSGQKAGSALSGKRSFTEVLFECKDEKGVEKTFAIEASVSFSELLHTLKSKYGRPVTFMYESNGHQFTVKTESDFVKCWDSLELTLRDTGDGSDVSVHLEAFIVDFNSDRAIKGGRERVPLLERRKDLGDRGSSRSRKVAMDFSARNRWIDDMMRLLGAPLDDEPASMQGKWDILIQECAALDMGTPKGVVTVEGFRNALIRTEPRMSAEDVEWYVRDAQKNDVGDVLYQEYAQVKKVGQANNQKAAGSGASSEAEIWTVEAKINRAMRSNFKSLLQAFKRMDVDHDGRLSREEFRKGVENRLKLKLPSKILDEIIRRSDKLGTGFIDYEHFLETFNKHNATSIQDGKHDTLSDSEIAKYLLSSIGNIAQLFDEMDESGLGVLNSDDIHKGLIKAGLNISQGRNEQFLAWLDVDKNRKVDYQEFMKRLAAIDLRELRRDKWDSLAENLEAIKQKMREIFDDAIQAFHSLDEDADGRLSKEEFHKGLVRMKVFDGESDQSEKISRIFEYCDSIGDGFIAYHEFLFNFEIRPKSIYPRPLFDQKLRSAMLKKYGRNITEAFRALDHDRDNRLSREDLKQALTTNFVSFADEKIDDDIESLFKRSASIDGMYIDYYDFIVHFGLDSKTDGRWIFKTADELQDSGRTDDSIELAVNIFREKLPASKWFGRGGIEVTLRKFDISLKGSLTRKNFKIALQEGLKMGDDLSDEDIDIFMKKKDGSKHQWCDLEKDELGKFTILSLNIRRFIQSFVDVYFDTEKVLFDVLLVQNRWPDLLQLLNTYPCIIEDTLEGEIRFISKADFCSALQIMVENRVIKANERQSIIKKMDEDKCFQSHPKYIGYIDYYRNFLEKYIAEEIKAHEIIFPIWEKFDREFEKQGSLLTYSEFEILCENVSSLGNQLTSDQIHFLIDVIDRNGDGTISRSEFVERYARENAKLRQTLLVHWHPVRSFLLRERNTMKSGNVLTAMEFRSGLLNAFDHHVLGTLSRDEVFALANKSLGPVNIDDWIKNYVSEYFLIHMAFQGLDAQSKIPKWDLVISAFENVDACWNFSNQAQESNTISWDQFRKCLRQTRIDLDDRHVQIIIDHFDPTTSGQINWSTFVYGVGPTGVDKSPPFFLNGGEQYEVLKFLRRHWRSILAKCRAFEAQRSVQLKLARSTPTGFISKPDLLAILQAISPPKNSQSVLDLSTVAGLIVNSYESAFGKHEDELQGGGKKSISINYLGLCKYIAGQSFEAEKMCRNKWETIVEILNSAAAHSEEPLLRSALETALRRPELGISETMIEYLLQDVKDEVLDVDSLSWRCGQSTIAEIMQKQWSSIMLACRKCDPSNSGRLDGAAMETILGQADFGLTKLQFTIFLKQWKKLDMQADGKFDYDRLLRGELNCLRFHAKEYIGWRTMEMEWEQLAEHFWKFDVNADGTVSRNEFVSAISHLKKEQLTDISVINAIFDVLDPEGSDAIDYEGFSWEMAKSTLRQVLLERGMEVLSAFRNEIIKQYTTYHGSLPRKEAEKLLRRTLEGETIKSIHIKVLVTRAEKLSTTPELQERSIANVIRELVGDYLDVKEVEHFRSSFSDIYAVSKYMNFETWTDHLVPRLEIGAIKGVTFHDSEALRHVGAEPVRRTHMQQIFGRSDEALLPSMRPSDRLLSIQKYRDENVYRSEPWRDFWRRRATSWTDFAASQQVLPRTGSSGRLNPHALQGDDRPALPRTGSSGRLQLQRVQGGLKELMSAKFDSREQAGDFLDPGGRGSLQHEQLTEKLETLGLEAGQIKDVISAFDPKMDGYILTSELLAFLFPPPDALSALAEARQRAGVYLRLRELLDKKGRAAGRGQAPSSLRENFEPWQHVAAPAHARAPLLPAERRDGPQLEHPPRIPSSSWLDLNQRPRPPFKQAPALAPATVLRGPASTPVSHSTYPVPPPSLTHPAFRPSLQPPAMDLRFRPQGADEVQQQAEGPQGKENSLELESLYVDTVKQLQSLVALRSKDQQQAERR